MAYATGSPRPRRISTASSSWLRPTPRGRVPEDAILVCHGIWFDHDNWGPPIQFRTPEWFAHLYRAFSQPARVVSVDTNSISVIRALWPDLAARMRYLPNWVDRNVFRPASREGERLTVLFPRRAEVNRGLEARRADPRRRPARRAIRLGRRRRLR